MSAAAHYLAAAVSVITAVIVGSITVDEGQKRGREWFRIAWSAAWCGGLLLGAYLLVTGAAS